LRGFSCGDASGFRWSSRSVQPSQYFRGLPVAGCSTSVPQIAQRLGFSTLGRLALRAISAARRQLSWQ